MADAPPPEPGAERSFPCGLILLAAGASTRMGQPKQLLEVGGRPLLVRAVEAALAAPVWPVVVVLGANAAMLRPLLAPFPVLVVENAAWSEGMASSLREGVTTLTQFSRRLEAAVVVLADQPALDATVIRRLIAAHHASGRDLVAARYSGRHGAPALFHRRLFPRLTALTGEAGARELLNGGDPPVTPVDLPQMAADLDTPEDLRRWRAAQDGEPSTPPPQARPDSHRFP